MVTGRKRSSAKTSASSCPSPHREQHDTYLGNYLHTGHAKIIGIGREIVARRKNGAVFPMDLSVSEVRLADRRLFTGFIRDITERKRLEKEILEISEREQRRIGHDLHDGLCQHLAGIELMSQVLEQKLTPRSKDAAKRAGDIAKNVREAIGQTRSLARGLSLSPAGSQPMLSADGGIGVVFQRLHLQLSGYPLRLEHGVMLFVRTAIPKS